MSVCRISSSFYMSRPSPRSTLFPYTTLFRSEDWDDRTNSRRTLFGAAPFPAHEFLPEPQGTRARSEEHTSELQSRFELVCRLLLEKKNMIMRYKISYA